MRWSRRVRPASVGRGQRELTRRSVELLVDADTSQLALVRSRTRAELLDACRDARLVVTRDAALSALRQLLHGDVPASDIQAWASFVRWSHLDIDYDPAWEDDIVEVVGRLDEIGDIIDGVVTRGEILNLMQLMGVADPK